MEGVDIGEWIKLGWDNIRKIPKAYGIFKIQDNRRNLVSSGEGNIKEILSEFLLNHRDDELFFEYEIRAGEVDLDELGYWINSKDEEEKMIQEWADSLSGYLSRETIEDFKKLCSMDFEKRRKTK